MSQDTEKLPIIKLGQENAPVLIDLKKNDETSLFSSVYDEAYEKIEDYIKNIIERNSASNDNKNNPIYRSENFNNIFAFCGERGSGKTSCMQTVAYNINYRFESKYKFEVLDIIDPSFFDSTHNILELVISQLFKKFTKKLEQLPCHCNDHESIQNKKRLLIKQFQTVKENITNLEAKCDPDETIESLAKLSASMDLGKSIHDLVDKYLEFSDKSIFLVIQIDDIDLNTEHAYKMIEQIRKYLIQSNIIILMAAKLEQLNDVVKLDYQIKFEKLIHAKKMNGDISDYADKYLAKLIPDTKRINLPDIKTIINKKVEIRISGYTGCESLLQYFQKTISDIFGRSNVWTLFLPDNLRQLLGICNSIASRKKQISQEEFIFKLNNRYSSFIPFITQLQNSPTQSLNTRALLCIYQTFRDMHPDIKLNMDEFYKKNEFQINKFGLITTSDNNNISLSDIIKTMISMESIFKSPSIDNGYILFIEYIKNIYNDILNKNHLVEHTFIKNFHDKNLISVNGLDDIINKNILEVIIPIKFDQFKLKSVISYLRPKGCLNEDLDIYYKISDHDLSLFSDLEPTEKDIIYNILNYYNKGTNFTYALEEDLSDITSNAFFNLYYAWYTWIKNESFENSMININKVINAHINIDELINIHKTSEHFSYRYLAEDIKSIISITRFSLLKISKTESCNNSSDFQLILNNFDHIYRDMYENEGKLIKILGKILE